jgi:hypothetical protein
VGVETWEEVMHRLICFGVGVVCFVWVCVFVGLKPHIYRLSPFTWSPSLLFFSVITVLCGAYYVYRTTVSKRTKAEWFARSGVLGRFPLKETHGGYFFRGMDVYDPHLPQTISFVWIGKGGRSCVTELAVDKIFLDVHETYVGEPVVEFVFDHTDDLEPFLNIYPRMHSPCWWLNPKNAEKVGFCYARILLSAEDYLSESLYVSFLSSHVCRK